MRRLGAGLVWIVGALVGLTAASLGAVGWGTVRASADATMRRGLDYHVFLSDLDDLVRKAGDDSLVRFDVVTARLRDGSRVSWDTLVVVADTVAFPSFRPAGFLRDQADAYNAFQRERIAVARERPEWFYRLEPFNPSIFRSRRTGDEAPALTRSSAAWSLRVRSPAEEEWDGEIRAGDVHRGNGLMGPRGTIPLRRPVRLTRRVDGRRQVCEFSPNGLDVRAYCRSEERIPQAILRMAAEPDGQGSVLAGWSDLWVDGNRVASGDSVPLSFGSLLGIDPLEPLVYGEYWEGVLSSKQWISGRMRRRSAFAPPLDFFSELGNRPTGEGPRPARTASIQLSVDAAASEELTARLRAYLDGLPLPVDFATLVVGRVPDGEILALAEVGNRRSPGRSSLLERVTPGSAVKPLLAAAVLSRRPELATLEIPARQGKVRSVLGLPAVPERRAFETDLNCAPPADGWVDLEYFLRCSDNEYAASLVMAGVWDGKRLEASSEPSSRFGLQGRTVVGFRPDMSLDGSQVPREELLRSDLSEGLGELFDVPTDPTISDAIGRSRRIWSGMTYSDGTPVDVPPELLPSESRPALLSPAHPRGTELGLLYRYAFGAWENGWTLLDLTNGFGRVVTDQRIQLGFASPPAPAGRGAGAGAGDTPGDSTADEAGKELGLRRQAWYPGFLAGLRGVAVDGTARGLAAAWRDEGLPEGVFVKTGTLAESGEAGPGDDLYLKSLLFAVGKQADAPDGRLRCGLVGGLYVRFREGPVRGALPSYQVDFARRELGRYLRAHWEEFGGC
jgi:hypothetical protein